MEKYLCVKDAEGGDEGAGADPPQRGGTDTPKQPDGGAVLSDYALDDVAPPARPSVKAPSGKTRLMD